MKDDLTLDYSTLLLKSGTFILEYIYSRSETQ